MNPRKYRIPFVLWMSKTEIVEMQRAIIAFDKNKVADIFINIANKKEIYKMDYIKCEKCGEYAIGLIGGIELPCENCSEDEVEE